LAEIADREKISRAETAPQRSIRTLAHVVVMAGRGMAGLLRKRAALAGGRSAEVKKSYGPGDANALN